jgi:hypothetical protein
MLHVALTLIAVLVPNLHPLIRLSDVDPPPARAICLPARKDQARCHCGDKQRKTRLRNPPAPAIASHRSSHSMRRHSARTITCGPCPAPAPSLGDAARPAGSVPPSPSASHLRQPSRSARTGHRILVRTDLHRIVFAGESLFTSVTQLVEALLRAVITRCRNGRLHFRRHKPFSSLLVFV